VPDVTQHDEALVSLKELPGIVRDLALVGDVWLPLWEERFGRTLEEAVAVVIDEGRQDLARINVLLGDPQTAYRRAAEELGGLDPASRGSGMKSALLAGLLAHLFQEAPTQGMIAAANVLGSDTDTIASMAGRPNGLSR
jgi:hypothetical protein